MDKPYAIVGPDNKAINFITWNGTNKFDYGQVDGNYLVPLQSIESYGFGWVYDSSTRTFTDPNPPQQDQTL